LLGLVPLLRSRSRLTLYWLLFPLFYFLAMIGIRARFDHYFLPLLPSLLLLSGAGIAGLFSRAGLRRWLGILLALAVVVPMATNCQGVLRRLSNDHTMTQAARWLAQQPADTGVAFEMDISALRFFAGRPHVYWPRLLGDYSLATYHALGIRYLITAHEDPQSRYRPYPEYRTRLQFYDELPRAGRLVAEFAPQPGVSGPLIRVWELSDRR
ncbi:MAG TPA: hypothetical protein PKM88_16535, partial [bacterium]|nr:hypothetical protein [bacterium]